MIHNMEKFLAGLLALLPVSYIYMMPGLGLNMGIVVLLFIISPVAYILYKKGHYKLEVSHWRYVFFVGYIFIVSFFYGSAGNMVMLFVLSVPFHLMLTANTNIHNYFLKAYIWLSFAFSAFLIVQDISILFFSRPIEGLISFLPRATDVESSFSDNNIYIRISSVFSEPSHFSLYTIPSACILLWKIQVIKHRLFVLSSITAANFMSTSGNGIVLIIIIYTIYIVHSNIKRFDFRKLTIAGTILVTGVFILNMEIMQNITSNLFSENAYGYDKSEYRIKRGFRLFSDMPVKEKTFGIGWGNAENLTRKNYPEIYAKYVGDARFDYFNSIAGILIYTGLLGMALFMVFIYSLFVKAKSFGEKVIIFIVLLTMVSSSVFMAETWLLYLMIIYSTRNARHQII